MSAAGTRQKPLQCLSHQLGGIAGIARCFGRSNDRGSAMAAEVGAERNTPVACAQHGEAVHLPKNSGVK